ncbi:DUF2271 domain-containing protein [Geosporobacter ferrireducens]|nr:DUF2271 domain-containing protein [Geosporobacter ferrireducens]MTI57389.1 DUF2271 domain-containing protein [Geosporobacter ferrireducens]
MKKRKIILGTMILVICIIIFFIISPEGKKVINLKNDMAGSSVIVDIYKGEHYLHDFKVNYLITIKTPPQMAIWVEDLEGNYIDTLYVTRKTVNQSWSKAPSDPTLKDQIQRKESLPYWTHKRGDSQIAPDAITSATPKGNLELNTKLNTAKDQFVVLAEINMSTDFNEYYPKEAIQGDNNYSGGEFGSGQPSIIYAATINAADNKTYELVPIGHSSPDGSNGNLYSDLTKLTTAKNIVDKIAFTINR